MTSKEESREESTHRVATSGDLEVSAYLEIARENQGEQPLPEGSPAAPGGEAVVILDFGSQYSQLIARRVRECKVYCELMPFDAPWEQVAALQPRGIILSGGPASVYDPGAPLAPPYVFESRLPVLGICYGMQLLAHQMGGKVGTAPRREYGHAILHQSDDSPLFHALPTSINVWMSHGDQIVELPPGFRTLASTENAPIAAMGNDEGAIGIQFHPEVVHTPQGKDILRNFLYRICGCHGTWTAASFIQDSISRIRRQVDTGRVLCALSGGVDSSVAATLIHKAVGDQLTCIFVNNGLLRKEEAERTLRTFQRHLNMDLIYVDASERFLSRLSGIVDPETKRKVIGEEFIRVFEAEAQKLGKVDFLAQGTLYPDVIESVTPDNRAAAKIKTHHNVGGLPSHFNFSLIEPLRYLFKDEVREVGLTLGLPEEMVWRQPFPGPGLAIRVIGDVTQERLDLLREADWIVINEMKKAKQYGQVWQSFAILTPLCTVGVMGDSRTYGNVVALRAVTSEDAMTADWARLPYDLLARISSRIVNEVPGINRVVYDITSKPPGTIEWE